MDRSFLSQAEVIAASRAFVCIRLATYEDSVEAKFMANLFTGGSGEVENTTFCILAPDGEERLWRAGRGPSFSDAAAMARTMTRIAAKYPGKEKTSEPAELPKVENVRLAINVAACDHQPLVVILAKSNTERKELERTISQLAWNSEFIGQFVFAATENIKDLKAIQGVNNDAKLLVVQPDEFGLKGVVAAQSKPNATADDFATTLREGLKSSTRNSRSHSEHVRKGHELGKFWETKLPVTDPHEAHARQQGQGGRP